MRVSEQFASSKLTGKALTVVISGHELPHAAYTQH
jgi:hypothetical protein